MSSMDPLHGVRLKLDRAAHHLDRLDAEITAYTDSRPYTPVIKDQAALNEVVGLWPYLDEGKRREIENLFQVVATKVRPVPDIVPLILGDFLHNLRASLDYLADTLVRFCNLRPVPGGSDGTAFRIWRHGQKRPEKDQVGLPVRPLLNPRTRDDIERAIDDLQLYNGWDSRREMLARVGELNNIDKHRALHVATNYVDWSRLVFTFPNGVTSELQGRLSLWQDGEKAMLRFEEDTTIGVLQLSAAAPQLLAKPGEVQVDAELALVVSLNEAGTRADPAVPLVAEMRTLLDFVAHDVIPTFENLM